MKDLIFNIKDNEIEILYIKKFLNRVVVNEKFSIPLFNESEVPVTEAEFNTTFNIVKIRKILKSIKIKHEKVTVIFSMDGIITREVDIPIMKKKDLKNFIKHNMEEYFTANKEDYYFDYKITSKVNSEKPMYRLLLGAIPKPKTEDVLNLIKSLGLKVKKIDLYPNCILNLFDKVKTIGVAVLDISSNKGSISIIREEGLFLYSLFNTDIKEKSEVEFKEAISNFTYFLNFYASRNFGKKVDSIYLIGEYAENSSLYKAMIEEFDADILIGYENHRLKFKNKTSTNKYENAEVIGLYTLNPSIYNKSIEFKEAFSAVKQDRFKSIIPSLAMGLITLTILWILLFTLYIYRGLRVYNTDSLDKTISQYNYVESKIATLNKDKAELNEKEKILKDIELDNFDYMGVFNALKNGLPNYCRIKSVSMEKEKLNIVFQITDKKTMDAAKLIIAINKLQLFEPVEIQQLQMDDTVDEVALELRIKK